MAVWVLLTGIICMSSFDKRRNGFGGRVAGFTLPELVIILAILGFLALFVIPYFQDNRARSRQPSILEAADKELARLDWQEMAYTAPERMEIGSTMIVDVALGGNKTIAQLIPLLENAGKAEGQRIQVSDRMEARLTGNSFEIVANTPETQLVSTAQATKWQWQVKANNLGDQKLYLSLNALLSVNGKDTTKSVRTFQRVISVQVTSIAGTWAFVERYWVYLTAILTAVIIPIFVYLWKRLNKAKGSKSADMPNKMLHRTPRKQRR